MTNLTDRLAEIRARVEAATEGPWEDVVDALNEDVDVYHDREYRLWIANTGNIFTASAQGARQILADAEFIAASRTDLPALLAAVEAVMELHPRKERLLCGAMSEVPHRHGDEQKPYPSRPVVCTLEQGHDGDHQDSICCWNSQRFTEAACYKSEKWADRSTCARCGQGWPCADVRAITTALEVQG